jgi:hypothetical protein
MALGHMLAIEGSEPSLLAAAGPRPVVGPDQVVLIGRIAPERRGSSDAE